MNMKPIVKARANENMVDFFPPTPRKDLPYGFMKLACGLVLFMAGTVLGMAMRAQFNWYFTSHTELFFPEKIYSADCERETMILKYFVKPIHLMHKMTDDELFWRATLLPKVQEYPFKRVPKVAFMFLTRGPLPFSSLWDVFFKGHEGLFSVYVHALPDYQINVPKNSSFYQRQIPSEEVQWGSVTLLEAEKRLLANALLDFSNERFVLLSESCIPVFNFPTVYDYLINSAHSFVQSYDDESPRGRGRYNTKMHPTIELSQWRKGSEWFELNRELAIDIVADYKYYRIFQKLCRPSCYPDEHYIPTYLNMFHGALNANRTVTWVDWSRLGPHPATYGRESITESFIKSIRNSGEICKYNNEPTSICYLFARKFAPSALEPLLNLTSTVMDF
ncbi:glycosyltransferase BC10-like [Dendrobium catenatum]|uniref:Core-2/I-branching beta-1,6-N-acetylglucosaminyltransferase family protein n=1 Tax=Dendrobium catenatum TaxID=906689 RepID=A0A2I0WSD1_9ASPA|nr:glycosyltransferase BC10-like [Dendrobium catenatum]PKU78570.1 hypothetical protein MA16_Dca011127 [Dendrobium catenatum]